MFSTYQQNFNYTDFSPFIFKNQAYAKPQKLQKSKVNPSHYEAIKNYKKTKLNQEVCLYKQRCGFKSKIIKNVIFPPKNMIKKCQLYIKKLKLIKKKLSKSA